MSKKITIARKPTAQSATRTSDSSAALDAFVTGEKRSAGEKHKRFTFDVPESLHRRVKAGCATRGIDMADLMRAYLEKEFPEP
jgi:hypothetical protein